MYKVVSGLLEEKAHKLAAISLVGHKGPFSHIGRLSHYRMALGEIVISGNYHGGKTFL